MSKKILSIRIDEKYYIGIESSEKDKSENLDKLINAVQSKTVSKVLEAIIPLWFKGKYYSTPKNYYTVLNTLDIDSGEYIKAIENLINHGVLVEERERVYVLGEGFYILTQEEINKVV